MTRRFYLIGSPVAHSLSPAMYRAAFAALEVDYTYEPVEVAVGKVAATLSRLRSAGGYGVNITMPHKGEACLAARALTGRARVIGAVNTVRLCDWAADNTDAPGLERALEEAASAAGMRGALSPGGDGVVFGAGGAARAAAFALAQRGLRVTVVSRRTAQAQEVIPILPNTGHAVALWLSPAAGRAVAVAAVLVNATPLGMGERSQEAPVDGSWRARAGALACDLVYRPPETAFLRWARPCGAVCVPGLEVLLWQGVLAMEFWGLRAPVTAMRLGLATESEKVGPAGREEG